MIYLIGYGLMGLYVGGRVFHIIRKDKYMGDDDLAAATFGTMAAVMWPAVVLGYSLYRLWSWQSRG